MQNVPCILRLRLFQVATQRRACSSKCRLRRILINIMQLVCSKIYFMQEETREKGIQALRLQLTEMDR